MHFYDYDRQVHIYGYVNGNPLSFTDPYGLEAGKINLPTTASGEKIRFELVPKEDTGYPFTPYYEPYDPVAESGKGICRVVTRGLNWVNPPRPFIPSPFSAGAGGKKN